MCKKGQPSQVHWVAIDGAAMRPVALDHRYAPDQQQNQNQKKGN